MWSLFKPVIAKLPPVPTLDVTAFSTVTRNEMRMASGEVFEYPVMLLQNQYALPTEKWLNEINIWTQEVLSMMQVEASPRFLC